MPGEVVASTVWRSSGGTRGSRSRISRTCSCKCRKRASISGAGRGRLGDVQAARQQEGIALDELADAEALHALADQVMAALRAGHVAHDVGDRAGAMQVVRPGLVLLRVALQHDQDLALLAHRLLGGGDLTRRVPTVMGKTISGKQHGVAHRHDDQGVGRQRPRSLAGGAGIHIGRAHGLAFCAEALGRRITRQPLATTLRGFS